MNTKCENCGADLTAWQVAFQNDLDKGKHICKKGGEMNNPYPETINEIPSVIHEIWNEGYQAGMTEMNKELCVNCGAHLDNWQVAFQNDLDKGKHICKKGGEMNNPYPEKIMAPGINVSSGKHKAWNEGYKAALAEEDETFRDMYEALKVAYEAIDRSEFPRTTKEIESALAKAEGK